MSATNASKLASSSFSEEAEKAVNTEAAEEGHGEERSRQDAGATRSKDRNMSHERLIQEITIKAPASRIFDAVTSPMELVEWWGVAGKFQVTEMESDLRPGGKWRMHLVSGSGTKSSVAGEYREIDRPWLLSFTWNREQDDSPETLVRWDLEEKNGMTTVRVTHSGFVSEEQRTRNSGWPLIVELLKAHVEGGGKA
jgi:uncharacterized protein YndB with AHSA1/START domain